MKNKICISLIIAGALTNLNALTLKEAVFKVSQTNPSVLEKRTAYEEVKKDLEMSKTEWLPSLDFQSSVNYKQGGNLNNDVNNKGYESFSNSLKLTQNIFNGFSTTEKINYQNSRVLSAYYNYIEILNDTAFLTAQSYLEVIKMKELMKNAKDNLEVNEKIYKDVSELLNSGLTTKSEMTKIKASYSLAESNYIVSQNNLLDKKLKLERLIGEKVNENDLSIPNELNVDKEISIKSNPSLLVSEQNIKSSRHLSKEKESKYLPVINLEAEQSYNDSRKNSFEAPDDRSRVGITLNWNLYKGGADKIDIEKSKIAILKEHEIKNKLEREVKEQVDLSIAAYKYLGLQITKLEDYKKYSEETLDSYQSEYEMGRRTMLDLLSAQNDVVNSKAQIINATLDKNFATYRIADAQGSLVTSILDIKDYKEIKEEKTTGEKINELLKASY